MNRIKRILEKTSENLKTKLRVSVLKHLTFKEKKRKFKKIYKLKKF